MKRNSLLVLAAMSLLVAGCATAGKDFDETKVDQIKVNETTRAQVVEIFGEPNSRTNFTKNEKGAVLRYTYSWGEATAFFGTSSKSKALVVDFDENDVVVDKAYSEQEL